MNKLERKELVQKFLTLKKKKIFKMIDENFFIYDDDEKKWLHCIFTNKEFKEGIKYFDKCKMHKEIFDFLDKNYKKNFTSTDNRMFLKIIRDETKINS